MGESHENLLKAVRHYQESLDKYTENRNDGKLLHYLEKLYKLPIKVVHLEQTGVGRTVNGLRKLGGEVGDSAKCLVAKWKEMVVGEQEEEEEDDDEDDEEEDEEDGYQTGEESDEKDTKEERTRSENSSSHRKSDSNRTEERDKARKSSKHRDSSKEKKDKHRHHRNNGHSSSKHKSHKRKSEDSSSDEETARKRQKKDSSSEEEGHSEAETRSGKDKKQHRSDEERRKHKTKKSRASSSETEDTRVKNKDKHKAKKESESKRHEHSSKKTKEKEKKGESSRTKETHKKSEEKKHKSSTTKTPTKVLSHNGIDSGSGASFAEALGMCEPSSSSKNSSKKKASSTSSEKKEKEKPSNNGKTEDLLPKLLKDPVSVPAEALDINISSLLPPITPNYRPLGNLLPTDNQPKKFSNEYEALSHIITSKNQRTKVYSGNKIGGGKVASLFELCVRVLQDNIDELGYTGGVPYSVLKPILEKSTPNQLYILEHHNPYLIEDTDELWAIHCQKEFRNKKREEFESWREMYLRCLDERDAKLKALTANIKQAQDKSLPVRTTKLAYVDAVAKPPRNIARKQAKNGTAAPERKTGAKLSALATAGEAGKVAVPNPGARAAERHPAAASKPKKAPLMLKSISSFKNRFKR